MSRHGRPSCTVRPQLAHERSLYRFRSQHGDQRHRIQRKRPHPGSSGFNVLCEIHSSDALCDRVTVFKLV